MDLILTILAIIIGPIAAVQVQKWIEGYREKNARKLNVFKTLMATRGDRLSFEHVRSLNMIDTEFYGEVKITDAWKCYLDCLSENYNGEIEFSSWSSRKDNLFVDLLRTMAASLNYHFDGVHLKKAVYLPRAHGEEVEYQYFVRDKIKKLFSEEFAIPIKLVEPAVSREVPNREVESRLES